MFQREKIRSFLDFRKIAEQRVFEELLSGESRGTLKLAAAQHQQMMSTVKDNVCINCTVSLGDSEYVRTNVVALKCSCQIHKTIRLHSP